MSWVAVGMVGASVVSGIIADSAASGDRAAARQAASEAYQAAMSLGLPPDLSQQLVLKQFKSAGTLTPQMEEAVNLGISQTSQIKEDPSLRNAQSNALQLMQQRGNAGLSASDRSDFNKLRAETARDAEAKRQQIAQNFMARGQGGAGAELMAQLQQAQSSANQESDAGDRISAQASKNALDAISKSSSMASDLRSQDFSVAKAKADAADAFSRFNTEQQIARQARNVASSNAAQKYNLDNAQQISNANTQLANNETERENEAKRTYWNDQMQRIQMQNAARLGQASNLNAQANATAKQITGIGSAVSSGIGAYGNYQAQQKQTDAINNLADATRSNSASVVNTSPVSTGLSSGNDDDWEKKYGGTV